MGWKEVAAIRKKYALLRHDERLKRDLVRREAEAERKEAHKALEDKHKGDMHMIEEGFNQAMADFSESEADEIEGAQR